jgi:hypothetical protein
MMETHKKEDEMTILAGLYFALGGAYMLPHPALSSGKLWLYDINEIRNPYGVVSVGWTSPEERRWAFTVELRHESSIPGGDNGTNTIEARLTWRPFK